MSDRCMWCDKDATLLCDAVIGFPAVDALRVGGSVTLLTGADRDGNYTAWTCDAPMCGEHATMVGHVCGEEPDTIDHCPHHMTRGESEDLVMFARESEAKRREIHAQIRRAAMRERKANSPPISPLDSTGPPSS